MNEKSKINYGYLIMSVAIVGAILFVIIFVLGKTDTEKFIAPVEEPFDLCLANEKELVQTIGIAEEALTACLLREEEAIIERDELREVVINSEPQECPAPIEIMGIREILVPDLASKEEIANLKERLAEKDLILTQLQAEWQAERDSLVDVEFSCEE